MGQAGIYSGVTFSVSDGLATTSQVITITVNNVNQPPVLSTIGEKQTMTNQLIRFTITAFDLDNDTLLYSASNLPMGAEFNSETRTFTWTPASNQVGTYLGIHFSVSDGSLFDTEDITITVSAPTSLGGGGGGGCSTGPIRQSRRNSRPGGYQS